MINSLPQINQAYERTAANLLNGNYDDARIQAKAGLALVAAELQKNPSPFDRNNLNTMLGGFNETLLTMEDLPIRGDTEQ